MGKNLGEMVVRIAGDTAEFDKSINSTEARLAKFGETATKLGKSLSLTVTAPILAMGAGFIKLADTQLKAEAALTNAIRATGKEAEISVDSLKKYTAGLQRVTTFGDEAQLSALALVQQLGNLDEKGLKKVLPGLLDFSTAMGVDLQTAASLVGKTLGSSTNALARYGIEVDATASPTEKLAQLTDALGKKFDGAAEAAAKAGIGPLVQLKNAASDLGEEFGTILIPALTELVGTLREVVDWIQALDEEQKRMIITIGATAAAIGPLLIGLGSIIKAVGSLKIAFLALNKVMLANPWIAGAAVAAAGIVLIASAFKKVRKEINDIAEEQENRRVFSVERTMEENEAALAEFKKEITDTYAKANAATGKQRDLIRESAAELVKQYRIFEDQLEVQRKLNSYVDEQEVLQNRVNEATVKQTEELQKQERIAEDAATREKIRRDGVKKAREDALAATILGLEQIENKTIAGYITREKASEEIQAAYRKEIDALFLAGYAVGQLDPLTKQVSIGALRLAELLGKIGTEEQKYIKERGFQIEEQQGWIEDIEKAYKRETNNLEAAERRKREAIAKTIAQVEVYARLYVGIAQSLVSIGRGLIDRELQDLNMKYKAKTDAELAYQSFLDKKALQRYEQMTEEEKLEVDLKNKANDERLKADKELAHEIYKLELAAFKTNQTFAISQIAIETAIAVAKVWGQTGIAGIIAQAGPIAMGALQAAAVLAQKPPAPPNLAEGGVVMPQPGGRLVNVAEAGVPEIVGPLDKVESLLRSAGGGMDNTPIHLVVKLDSKPFLDKIFPATKNRTVLISAASVV
jgi:TP901 family phage tail tape measure protein